ncbi:MAG: LuxR family transcriptional regulator [bacterium]|nr:LuxR family transcriptional regulator [bacterium]
MQKSREIYKERTFEFIERVGRLDNYDLICQEIERELLWYGLTCVTIMKLPGPTSSFTDGILLNTRPNEYTEHYANENYLAKDPVVLELSLTMDSYSWGDVRRSRVLTKKQKHIIDEGREFGATDGVVVPIRSASGEFSIFSPCGEDPDLSKNARISLDIIGMYGFEALKRARVKERHQNLAYQPLTPREREVLQWVAAGKTDDEIAEILSVATTTTTFHVQNAKRKLDTCNRTYAVVKAIKYGEITI